MIADQDTLSRQGYALLPQAVPADWLQPLRQSFDEHLLASQAWPVPRGPGFQHALLDLDARVQAVCRLPALLRTVGALIGERFFLAQVEGREPLGGHGHQSLHRDLHHQRPGDNASALVFLDDYGPHNGATRLVPASHRPAADAPPRDLQDETGVWQLHGQAGDILVFDADLVHGGSHNATGTRRRSLLIGYFAEPIYASHLQSAPLRHVRMDTRDRFAPDGSALGQA